MGSAVLFVPAAPFFLLMHGKDTDIPAGTAVEVFASNDTNVDMGKAPVVIVPIAKVAPPATPEHVIEGYTISSSADGMGASGDGTSLADAARKAKAKRTAQRCRPRTLSRHGQGRMFANTTDHSDPPHLMIATGAPLKRVVLQCGSFSQNYDKEQDQDGED